MLEGADMTKNINSNLTSKIYTFVWNKDSMRSAVITFDATAPDKFRFTSCQFEGTGKIYDLDDWEFIGMLADEIKMLCERNGEL